MTGHTFFNLPDISAFHLHEVVVHAVAQECLHKCYWRPPEKVSENPNITLVKIVNVKNTSPKEPFILIGDILCIVLITIVPRCIVVHPRY